MTRTARWLDLIAFLLSHRMPVSRARIYENVRGYLADPHGADDRERESARRKFERDKDELRALGIKIETVPRPMAAGTEDQQGYRLKAGDFYLPYLEIHDEPTPRPSSRHAHSVRLTRDDVAVLDRCSRAMAQRTEFPLARATASARRKLAFDLPISPLDIERILAEPMSARTEDALTVLQKAVADRVAVRCTYYSIGRDAEEEREIEPQGLYFNWGRWYCVAAPRRRMHLRVFRVDRVRRAELIDAREGRFEPNPKFAITNYMGRSPWELSDRPHVAVRVRIQFPEYRWVMARGLGELIGRTAEESAEFVFRVSDEGPFLRWLLTLRNRAEVLEPSTTANALAALKRDVAAMYA